MLNGYSKLSVCVCRHWNLYAKHSPAQYHCLSKHEKIVKWFNLSPLSWHAHQNDKTEEKRHDHFVVTLSSHTRNHFNGIWLLGVKYLFHVCPDVFLGFKSIENDKIAFFDPVYDENV